jgi:hypothetical protein
MCSHDIKVREDWFVVFVDSQRPTRFLRWLQPSFQHCYMMKKSPGGAYWLILNPVRSHLSVSMELVSDYPHPREYEPQAVILPITVIADGVTPRGGLCWFNCVEVCKSIMGIKAFTVFTPFQLYKHIRSLSCQAS